MPRRRRWRGGWPDIPKSTDSLEEVRGAQRARSVPVSACYDATDVAMKVPWLVHHAKVNDTTEIFLGKVVGLLTSLTRNALIQLARARHGLHKILKRRSRPRGEGNGEKLG